MFKPQRYLSNNAQSQLHQNLGILVPIINFNHQGNSIYETVIILVILYFCKLKNYTNFEVLY